MILKNNLRINLITNGDESFDVRQDHLDRIRFHFLRLDDTATDDEDLSHPDV